jgi:hypothetical protein
LIVAAVGTVERNQLDQSCKGSTSHLAHVRILSIKY